MESRKLHVGKQLSRWHIDHGKVGMHPVSALQQPANSLVVTVDCVIASLAGATSRQSSGEGIKSRCSASCRWQISMLVDAQSLARLTAVRLLCLQLADLRAPREHRSWGRSNDNATPAAGLAVLTRHICWHH